MANTSRPPAAAWQVLERRPLLDRLPWIAVWLERVRLPNGVVIDDYFRVSLRSWVAIFAVTQDGRVPLVRQYRHGVGVPLLELPAGYVDEGEAPLAPLIQDILAQEAGLIGDQRRRILGYIGYEYLVDVEKRG